MPPSTISTPSGLPSRVTVRSDVLPSGSESLARTSTSRLTTSPTDSCPWVVSARVVGMSETSNQSSPTAETVKDVPLTAMEPFSTT